jgi:hypothetical protein
VQPEIPFVSFSENLENISMVNDLRMDDITVRHRESVTKQNVICTVVIAFLSGLWIDIFEFSPDDSR